jgi:hypothetical protein
MHSTEGPVHRLVPTKHIQNVCPCTPLNFLPTKASQNLWIGTDSRSGEGPLSPVTSSLSPPISLTLVLVEAWLCTDCVHILTCFLPTKAFQNLCVGTDYRYVGAS